MALSSVLVDRGRVLSRARTGATVEGTRQYATVRGPWFKCRLFPEETQEQEGARGGRRTLSQKPHVIVGLHDADGDKIVVGDIGPDKFLEVESADLGNATWQITSLPQPLRKKKGYIGHYFTVSLVEQAEAL